MITLALAPDLEARLLRQAQAHGLDLATYATRVLEGDIMLPPGPQRQRTPEEIRAWLDSLAQFSDRIPAMPGETFSRSMIYADHN